jgi:hypothetical protein
MKTLPLGDDKNLQYIRARLSVNQVIEMAWVGLRNSGMEPNWGPGQKYQVPSTSCAEKESSIRLMKAVKSLHNLQLRDGKKAAPWEQLRSSPVLWEQERLLYQEE